MELFKNADKIDKLGELESIMTKLKQEIENVICSAVLKAEMKNRMMALTKKSIEMQKGIAMGNKKKVLEEMMHEAKKASEEGTTYLVHRVDVGLDSKALLEAINAIQAKYEKMCVLLFSVDEQKKKALAYAVH